MLSDRGIIPPDTALELLDNPKVPCAACGVILDRNLEGTVSFMPDGGGEAVYFSSKECGERWQRGESFTCERSGLKVSQLARKCGICGISSHPDGWLPCDCAVQTSAPDEDDDGAED